MKPTWALCRGAFSLTHFQSRSLCYDDSLTRPTTACVIQVPLKVRQMNLQEILVNIVQKSEPGKHETDLGALSGNISLTHFQSRSLCYDDSLTRPTTAGVIQVPLKVR